jgi:hypothetical protein
MKFKKPPRAILSDRRKITAFMGLLLILISFGVMFQALQLAQTRASIPIAVKDLPLGKIVEAEDLKMILVDLGTVKSNYFSNPDQVVGKAVIRNISANELIALNMVGKSRDLRTVAMKLSLGSVPPDLAINDTIDIWWTNPENAKAENLIKNVNTAQVIKDGSGYASTITVVVAIPPQQVANLITAARTESLDVVKHEN